MGPGYFFLMGIYVISMPFRYSRSNNLGPVPYLKPIGARSLLYISVLAKLTDTHSHPEEDAGLVPSIRRNLTGAAYSPNGFSQAIVTLIGVRELSHTAIPTCRYSRIKIALSTCDV